MGNGMTWPINFTSPPPVGTCVHYYRGRVLRLVGASDYIRADGSRGWVLSWQSSDGKSCTSGARSKAVVWQKQPCATTLKSSGAVVAQGGAKTAQKRVCATAPLPPP